MNLIRKAALVGKKWQNMPHVNQGFTIIETLVSLLLTLTYLGITMNIMVSAAFLRAKATEYNEVYNWIQDDFEKIITKAKTFETSVLPHSNLCHPNNLSSGLIASFIVDSKNGVGGKNVDLGNRDFGTRTYSLERTSTPEENYDPNRLLKVKYTIIDTENQEKLVEINTKVILSAGFNCPYS